MWWNDLTTGFHCKTMAYSQSCFPCSLHLVLRNLGQNIAQDDSLEQAWNQMQLDANKGDLNTAAPDELDVHRNFGATPMPNSGIIISPAFLAGNATDQEIVNKVNSYFSSPKAGMVIGVAHANIVFKMGSNKYVFVHVSPDRGSVYVESDSNITVSVVRSNQSRAIRVNGGSNTGFVVAGNFCAIIT